MLSELERSLAFVAIIMLVTGILLWRGTFRRRMTDRDKQQGNGSETAATPESVIRDMEIRLFDYGREVEGRVETTLNVLDRLIIDAESEIGRLEKLLDTSQQRRTSSASESIDPERILQLQQAGLEPEEISRALQCDLAIVEHILEDQGKDAA